jgi:hypothetical protein
MLRELLAYADEHGFVRVVLNPSALSVPLYQRHGFSAEHHLLVRQRAR